MNVWVKLDIPGADELIRRKGLNPSGRVQTYHTANVLRRIQKYMPYRTGTLIKLTAAQTDISKPEIVTIAPQAAYLYYGKVMVGKVPKTVTDKDLVYTKDKNPLAGPFWDRALVTNEGPAIVQDLQDYLDGGNPNE